MVRGSGINGRSDWASTGQCMKSRSPHDWYMIGNPGGRERTDRRSIMPICPLSMPSDSLHAGTRMQPRVAGGADLEFWLPFRGGAGPPLDGFAGVLVMGAAHHPRKPSPLAPRGTRAKKEPNGARAISLGRAPSRPYRSWVWAFLRWVRRKQCIPTGECSYVASSSGPSIRKEKAWE